MKIESQWTQLISVTRQIRDQNQHNRVEIGKNNV